MLYVPDEKGEGRDMRQTDSLLLDKSQQAFCVIQGNMDNEKSGYDFHFVYLNDAFMRLEGMEKNQLMNKSVYQVFTEGSRKWVQFFYEAAYEEKTLEVQNDATEFDRFLQMVCFPIKRGYCGFVLNDYTNGWSPFSDGLCFAHFYADLNKDGYFSVYLRENMRGSIPKKGLFSELTAVLLRYVVYPDDYEDFCRALKKEYIRKYLQMEGQAEEKKQGKTKKGYVIDFRSMQEGELKNCSMTLIGVEQEREGEVRHIHIILQNAKTVRGREDVKDACGKVHTVLREKCEKNREKILESGQKQYEMDALMAADFSGRRLLLVEDNEVNREILAKVLMATGILVEKAKNGREALEFVKSRPAGYFDIIFMDIHMPFMNGYETAKAIRAVEQDKGEGRAMVIAMTASAFKEDVIAAKMAGMDGHIAKPIDFKQLKEMLEKWLGEKSIVK